MAAPRSEVVTTPDTKGKAQSSSSMATPSRVRLAGFHLPEPQHHRLMELEQLAGRDPGHQRVADLPGRARHGDVDWPRSGHLSPPCRFRAAGTTAMVTHRPELPSAPGSNRDLGH